MSHDMVAELAGYDAELAREENRGRGERADAVREQIGRVRKAIGDEADALEQQAKDALEAGQDVRAAELTVQARDLRQALEDAGPKPAPMETAEESKPRRTATSKKTGGS